VADIAVEHLTKRYGTALAVDDLSFSVDAGRVTGFLGPNGAGKSTTLRALLGLVRPTGGRALIEGRPYADLTDPAMAVGAALEATAFHPGRSGRSHLRGLAAAAGLPRSRVEEVLGMVDLLPAADRRVAGYSLGMRQRLALATALLGDPRILLLDEPANGLDPQGMRWLRDVLRSLAGEGRAILVSSHVLSEVAQTVEDVIVIRAGRLVTQAPLREIVGGGQSGTLRVRSPAAGRLRELLEAQGATVTEVEGALRVAGVTNEAVGDLAAAQGIALHELTIERQSLEEVFLELTGKEGNVR
jgi:ABC-2 type transport system ATP-binding protein